MNTRTLKKKTDIIFPPLNSQADELAGFHRDMLRFAMLQLRDEALAEDAVQDALASALNGLEKFKNQSQLKTWVFTILRRKIIDIIRSRQRWACDSYEITAADAHNQQFDDNGDWCDETSPSDWGNPEDSFSNMQFWSIFEQCLHRLPQNTARIFMMREMLGFETSDICKELAISQSNCWVALHRARMALRICLNEQWFQREDKSNEM